MFVIPYLINRFGISGDLSYEEFWTEAEQKYFSLLAPDILQYLNLGAWQNRLSTHFPLSAPTSYRPLDSVIDVALVLDHRGKLFKSVTWNLGPTYFHIPHSGRGFNASYPWDFNRLANFYDGVNNRLFRDINRPPLLEDEMLRAASGHAWWYRDDMPPRGVSTMIEQWIANPAHGRHPDTAVTRQLWSAFLPDFDEHGWKNGFGYLALWHLLYSLAEWKDDEEAYVTVSTLWCELIESLWWIACYEHSVFLSERPVSLSFDANDRLHNADGPAVSFKDGYRQYYWHGVWVPAQAIENEPTVEAVEREPNIEVRRVLIERFGLQEYLFTSGAKVADVDQGGTLYRKNIPGDEPLVMLHVVNKTPEPDGSYKDYFLRVPPTMRTAREAVAWTFGLDADSYKPVVET